jgi:hypothetical protein
MRKLILVFTVMIVLGFAGTSRAELIDRGSGMIYDKDLNITWYDFTYHSSGWGDAMAWADTLSLTVKGVTYNDWRLPTTVDGPSVWGYDGSTTAGYNITSSEMGHLFHSELGNKGLFDTSGKPQSSVAGFKNTGPFSNLSGYYYWSVTEYGTRPVSAWGFGFSEGFQFARNKAESVTSFALAVHPGDVGVGVPVPVPGTILLLVPSLAGLFGIRTWKGRRHQDRFPV